MPLHNLIRLREPDSAAFFLRREIQLKNFLLDIRGNPGPLVPHLGYDRLIIEFGSNGQRSAIRHCLHAIQQYVEHRLFDEISIDSDANGVVWQLTHYVHPMLCRVRSREQCDLIKHKTQVCVFQPEVQRASEVD